jgi:hypothetical protein
MYERFIFEPRQISYQNPLALTYYGVPQFLAGAVDEIVKDYKTSEVRTKQLWSAVDQDKPLTLDSVTTQLRNKVKDTYGAGLVLEYTDSPSGRHFKLLKQDNNKRLMVGRLLSQNQSFKPAVVSGNSPGQSIAERRGVNTKEFVLDGLGQFMPRYVYRCLNNQDVVNLTNKGVFAILAKSVKAGNTMLEHVGGQKLTRFISTTRSRHEIQNPHGDTFDGGSKVKIDLSYIASSEIIDLSTERGETELKKFMGTGTPSGLNLQALKDVKRTKEVLIEKMIPGEAIVATRGFTLPNLPRINDGTDF